MKMQADNTDTQNEHQCKQSTVLSAKLNNQYISSLNNMRLMKFLRMISEGITERVRLCPRERRLLPVCLDRGGRSWCNTCWGLYQIDLKSDSSLESSKSSRELEVSMKVPVTACFWQYTAFKRTVFFCFDKSSPRGGSIGTMTMFIRDRWLGGQNLITNLCRSHSLCLVRFIGS